MNALAREVAWALKQDLEMFGCIGDPDPPHIEKRLAAWLRQRDQDPYGRVY
jgi:hypothetical protein